MMLGIRPENMNSKIKECGEKCTSFSAVVKGKRGLLMFDVNVA